MNLILRILIAKQLSNNPELCCCCLPFACVSTNHAHICTKEADLLHLLLYNNCAPYETTQNCIHPIAVSINLVKINRGWRIIATPQLLISALRSCQLHWLNNTAAINLIVRETNESTNSSVLNPISASSDTWSLEPWKLKLSIAPQDDVL